MIISIRRNAMVVLIDNGHGRETPGKRSPDGSVMEWQYAREVAYGVASALISLGYQVRFIAPEEEDVPLRTRCERVNAICDEKGKKNCVLVSIHLDAAGDGGSWNGARGFSARVANNAGFSSRELARIFVRNAVRLGMGGNRSVPSDGYWSQNLAICRDTDCAAVLTESAFMDNKDDVRFLMSPEGFNRIVSLHVLSIIDYIEHE